MKRSVKIAKVVQFGAGAGAVLTPVFMGEYRQQERQIVEVFWLVCVALALACLVLLWKLGERKRAWQGLVVTILLTIFAAVFSRQW